MVHVISVLLPLLTRNWSWERIAKRDDWHVSQTQEMTEGRAKKKNAATVGWRSKNANARIPVGNCVGGALEHLKWMNYLIFHCCIHVMTGGDFKHVLFSPWFWGNWSNLTTAHIFEMGGSTTTQMWFWLILVDPLPCSKRRLVDHDCKEPPITWKRCYTRSDGSSLRRLGRDQDGGISIVHNMILRCRFI